MTTNCLRLTAIAILIGGTVLAAEIPLAVNGKSEVTIFESANATPAEKTAAAELADYLHKISGGTFDIYPESAKVSLPSKSAIYVGMTKYAKEHGIETSELAPEEWVIRTVEGQLILTGGRPRGTLYAVHHFLEDVLNVHWWNPFEESVPSQATVKVNSLNLHGKPTFWYRDIYEFYVKDEGRFAARSRINRTGDEPMNVKWGGSVTYGLPYHSHTLGRYFAPSAQGVFEKHPEWFALVNGKRQCLDKTSGEDSYQMCLTNKELQHTIVQKLKDYIKESQAEALKQGHSIPTFYSVDMNDAVKGWCQCPECQKVRDAEGSQAGPLLTMVNAVADEIKKEYPDIYISTLAYYDAEKVPKHIRPRDNVIIRLCDIRSNMAEPITSPQNKVFRDHVDSWAKITKNLTVWDYGVTFDKTGAGMPVPSLRTYGPDYRYLADHHVQGAFIQFNGPILADMRDLKLWVLCKICENPYQDEEKLIQTFVTGFYGPAAPLILEYLKFEEISYRKNPSHLHWFAPPLLYTYVNLNFALKSQSLFDAAEKEVADDPVLLRHVRHARLPLDRVCLALYPKLADEFVQSGQPLEKYPLDRQVMAERIRATYTEQKLLRNLDQNGKGSEEDIELFLGRVMKLQYGDHP